MENLLEEVKDLVIAAMAIEASKNGRNGETYISLRSTLTELEDVWELEELSAESRSNIKILGFIY